MKRLRDFLEVEKEERIMRHILSREGILFWPLSHLNHNNPDLEYKQWAMSKQHSQLHGIQYKGVMYSRRVGREV